MVLAEPGGPTAAGSDVPGMEVHTAGPSAARSNAYPATLATAATPAPISSDGRRRRPGRDDADRVAATTGTGWAGISPACCSTGQVDADGGGSWRAPSGRTNGRTNNGS
ncbi:hypothetical protein GCM10025331_22790 [Actinoplanes utahensis]|nr:hypothetical protein Aut01nite_34590 [Actinoplanes utahensis]